MILIIVLYYLCPEHRFLYIPLAIAAIYVVSIWVLERRYRAVRVLAPALK